MTTGSEPKLGAGPPPEIARSKAEEEAEQTFLAMLRPDDDERPREVRQRRTQQRPKNGWGAKLILIPS